MKYGFWGFLFVSALAPLAMAQPIQSILLREALENGGSEAAAQFTSNRLIPAFALTTDAAPQPIQAVVAFIAAEMEAFLQAPNGDPKAACAAITANMNRGIPLGANRGPDTRSDDIEFFSRNSVTRTFWENSTLGKSFTELRQVYFVPKSGEVDVRKVYNIVTAYERSPSSEGQGTYHFYEYNNPLDPVNSSVRVRRVREMLPAALDLNKTYMIKKCWSHSIAGRHCNTIVHRAYQISQNLYALTSQLYNTALGDANIPQDALGSSGDGLRNNVADAYSGLYIITDIGNYIAVYSFGIQNKNGPIVNGFSRNSMQNGMIADLTAQRHVIEDELNASTKTCADFR